MSVDQQFTTINEKLQQLLQVLNRLQKENAKLKTELEAARNKEAQALQRVDELQEQAYILKLAAGEMSEKDKKDFETKINRYLRTIDKCITLLSQ